MHGGTACRPANTWEGVRSQLPGGNGSRQQNGRRNRCKQCGLANLFHHGSRFLSLKSRMRSVTHFQVPVAYGGSETHDPRVAPFICTQEHAPLHGWVALQRPLQTPITPGCLCNCRAETVPAHRTVITRAAKSVALILLPMIRSPFKQKSSGCRGIRFPSYFFGGLSGPGSLTHPPVVPLKIWQMQGPLHGLVALHVPTQAGNSLADVCNCRAETVPAQRTAVAIAAKNVFLIVLLMVHSPFQ